MKKHARNLSIGALSLLSVTSYAIAEEVTVDKNEMSNISQNNEKLHNPIASSRSEDNSVVSKIKTDILANDERVLNLIEDNELNLRDNSDRIEIINLIINSEEFKDLEVSEKIDILRDYYKTNNELLNDIDRISTTRSISSLENSIELITSISLNESKIDSIITSISAELKDYIKQQEELINDSEETLEDENEAILEELSDLEVKFLSLLNRKATLRDNGREKYRGLNSRINILTSENLKSSFSNLSTRVSIDTKDTLIKENTEDKDLVDMEDIEKSFTVNFNNEEIDTEIIDVDGVYHLNALELMDMPEKVLGSLTVEINEVKTDDTHNDEVTGEDGQEVDSEALESKSVTIKFNDNKIVIEEDGYRFNERSLFSKTDNIKNFEKENEVLLIPIETTFTPLGFGTSIDEDNSKVDILYKPFQESLIDIMDSSDLIEILI